MQVNMAELSKIKPKQEEAPRKIARCCGADGRIRTGDLILTKGDFAQFIIIIFMHIS